MSLNVFELREIDELLRDFDHMMWKADSRASTQFRIRIHVLLKRLEAQMKAQEQQAKDAEEQEAVDA
jgi:hypothetical protein